MIADGTVVSLPGKYKIFQIFHDDIDMRVSTMQIWGRIREEDETRGL